MFLKCKTVILPLETVANWEVKSQVETVFPPLGTENERS
jgi:hypothetical protein